MINFYVLHTLVLTISRFRIRFDFNDFAYFLCGQLDRIEFVVTKQPKYSKVIGPIVKYTCAAQTREKSNNISTCQVYYSLLSVLFVLFYFVNCLLWIQAVSVLT